MLDLILAVSLYMSPTADSPWCEPGQVSEIDNCTQGQLPEETIGRQIDPLPTPSETPTPEATQSCDEQIGRTVDIDGTLWVVIGIDENCEPELGLAAVPNFYPIPGPTDVAVVPEAPVVSQILDVAPDPTPELAETGTNAWIGFLVASGIIILGTIILNLPTWIEIRRCPCKVK